ncbi:ATP-binding protein [Luteipulveratus mongoliensis]|uniref:ATP-binding protein n=1 Tax=Luteipulveratus mongoliensis TaxID=571913 RepID=A0A0K1JDS3_9MICO|nr:SbcC/MukB-like Walker B domain-containing protein [Luteipulveratus mongoliensis]AKU14867.1 hypothetical protein VV02_01620 [Luteipulveratus mongoliensis]
MSDDVLTLDGMATVTETAQQWRLESLQLCNWGGFGGFHRIDIDAESTLLSGNSGSGKSTVMDAYTVLMHDTRTPLNSASNDTSGGRARGGGRATGEGARTVLSYVRGQFNRGDDPEGDLRPLTLRGDTDTWSALALVFASTSGARYSVIRTFFAPVGAGKPSDVKTRFATYDGAIDLSRFEAHAESEFLAGPMQRDFPGIQFHESYVRYAAKIHDHLGIGAHGDGAKALRLLSDLQRSAPVQTVDALYKRMVLERPRTYDKAEAVVRSFKHLDGLHQKMLRAEAQVGVLDGMEAEYASRRAAVDEIERVDTYRLAEPESSPFTLWARRTESDAYDAESAAAKADQAAAEDRRDQISAQIVDLDDRVLTVRQLRQDKGGDAIDVANQELARLNLQLKGVQTARARYEEDTRDLHVEVPGTRAEFEAAQSEAQAFVDSFDERWTGMQDERDEAQYKARQLTEQRNEHLSDINDLESRTGNISRRRHAVRLQFAQAAGLREEDLPFVGELVDMQPAHEDWRVAADAVLGGFANTLVVDERHGDRLRASIDSIQASERLAFEGVPIDVAAPGITSETTLAGRLIVKEGPFTGWLRDHLDRHYGYECVAGVSDLRDDDTSRVTIAGQTRRGQKGAHGGHGRRVIGFSNQGRIDELRRAMAELDRDIQAQAAQVSQLEQEMKDLQIRRHANVRISQYRWTDLDLEQVHDQISAGEEARQRLLDASGDLEALDRELETLVREQQGLYGLRGKEDGTIQDCEQRRAVLDTEVDALRTRLWRMEDDGVAIADDDAAALRADLDETGWSGRLADLKTHLSIIERVLKQKQTVASAERDRRESELTARFQRYQDNWPSNNIGAGIASYPDYLAILQNLTGQGLTQQRADWAKQVVKWGGEDVSDLYWAYEQTLQEIDQRMEPINKILAHIPFGAARSTLQMRVKRRAPVEVRTFKEELQALSSGSLGPRASDEEIAVKFDAIRDAMKKIATEPDNPTKWTPEADALLDVRRHLTVRAEQITDGLVTAVHAYLGDKSGGETQELVAFIVGAALRYQLGDELRDRPRFTPVLLDEAFIKADGRFAGRSVQAWKDLGFQLIIAVPESMVTALEASMNLVLAVTKNDEEYSYIAPMLKKGAT